MGNTAKIMEQELSPELEKLLREKAAPLVRDVQSGKIKGMPLMEAYELTMKNLAERRKARKK